MSRRSGTISFKADGVLYDVVGEFTYGLGKSTREGQVGHDGVHGYKELPTLPFLEGELRDGQKVSLDKIANITNATLTLALANGKTIVFNQGWCCNPDGLGAGTENGNIAVRFEAISAQEIM